MNYFDFCVELIFCDFVRLAFGLFGVGGLRFCSATDVLSMSRLVVRRLLLLFWMCICFVCVFGILCLVLICWCLWWILEKVFDFVRSCGWGLFVVSAITLCCVYFLIGFWVMCKCMFLMMVLVMVFDVLCGEIGIGR